MAAHKELVVFDLHLDSIWGLLPACVVGTFSASWAKDLVALDFLAEVVKHLGRFKLIVVRFIERPELLAQGLKLIPMDGSLDGCTAITSQP